MLSSKLKFWGSLIHYSNHLWSSFVLVIPSVKLISVHLLLKSITNLSFPHPFLPWIYFDSIKLSLWNQANLHTAWCEVLWILVWLIFFWGHCYILMSGNDRSILAYVAMKDYFSLIFTYNYNLKKKQSPDVMNNLQHLD